MRPLWVVVSNVRRGRDERFGTPITRLRMLCKFIAVDIQPSIPAWSGQARTGTTPLHRALTTPTRWH